MGTQAVSVPSVRGIKDAAGDAAVGAAGGLIYGISSMIFGNGLIGAVINTLLAGSAIKGSRGETIATISGFMLLSGVGSAGASNTVSAPPEEVM